ncbi:MAG: KH domain-containing protein [Chloroflexota bacterium]|nr:KH domain-containing protein [Chloroflexota bacterium]
MKELIEFIARSLVNDPMQVVVTPQRQGSAIELQLQVAQEDMGRVIGKHGRVANAMRSLLHVVAAQEGREVSLDIVEPR